MIVLSNSQRNDLSRVKVLAKWFSVRLTIKLFGRIILDYQWPPLTESEVCDENA